MIYFVLILIFFFAVITSKFILQKWVNHISIYSAIWFFMIVLYEIKLLPYKELIPTTWFFIFSVFFSFFIGSITIYFIRGKISQNNFEYTKSQKFFDISNLKLIQKAVIIFSLISILGALQHWYILIQMFGSLQGVFVNAVKVYQMNTSGGGVTGQWPFISNFGYVAIFWGAIYTAFKGKFNVLSFLPFIGVIIKETSTLGRAGMLLALLLFFVVFMLTRHLLTIRFSNDFKFSRSNAIFSIVTLATILIVSASLVKSTRISFEQYRGASSTLKNLEGNLILSPSIYLYFSAHIGVLNEFIKHDDEQTVFAQNTILPVYNFLDRIDLVERPSQYQKGYFIPMWVNTGTFIRELYSDFGVLGIFLVPYLLGFLCSYLWYKIVEKVNLYYLAVLSYLYIIVSFSFLVMITRTSYWIISLSLILISILGILKLFNLKKLTDFENQI